MKMLTPLNLQLFAEDEDAPETLTLTQDELDAKLQAESDRRVTKALETAKEKWEREYEHKIEEAKKEAADLAKLSEEERQRKEFEKQQSALEKERQDFMREKMELQSEKALIERGLDPKFVPFVLSADPEATMERITELEKTFTDAVEAKVTERLKGNTPKTGTVETKKPFGELTSLERKELKDNNPNLNATMPQEYINKNRR